MQKTFHKLCWTLAFWTGILWTTQAQNPNIWIQTDLTAATSYTTNSTTSEAKTDQNSDPDDHVAMAMYLMLAHKFNTRGIVVGITNRDTRVNTKTFFDNTFIKAYETDVVQLNARIGGYPSAESLRSKVMESSLTAGSGFTNFTSTPDNKYDDYDTLPATVKALVDQLKSNTYSETNPLYVLVWGGLQEVAMATKHLIRNGNDTALNRLFVVSHWTSSFSYQGSPSNPFGVANCNSGKAACDYMHNEAKKSTAQFRFVDLGACGQHGIVTGSGSWFVGGLAGARATELKKSKLGKLAMLSKFVFGKPDGSDCATFYTVLGTYGVTLADFNDNGVLTKSDEDAAVNAYKTKAPSMWDELLTISKAASDTQVACPMVHTEAEDFSAQAGVTIQNTHLAYINNGDYADYSVNVPCAGTYTFRVRVAAAVAGGTITLKKGSTSLGSVTFGSTGGWTTWQNKTVAVNLGSGLQTFRLAFSGNSTGFLFNVDWFELQKQTSARRVVEPDASHTIYAFPNPSSDVFTIDLTSPEQISDMTLYNQTGRMLYHFDPASLSGNSLTFGKELRAGFYVLRIVENHETRVIKLIKQ